MIDDMQPVILDSTLPFFEQIKQTLRHRILTGQLPPGQKLPGIHELSQRFQVSPMTLYRALGDLQNEGLVYRKVGCGTFVRNPEERMAQNQAVALVFPHAGEFEKFLAHDYLGPLLQGIREYASASGHHFSFREVTGNNYMALRRQGQATGLLLFAPRQNAKEELRKLSKHSVPFVVLGASWSDMEISCVDCDNIGAVKQAMEHLIDLGHQHIAIVNGGLEMTNSRDRFEAYQATLQAHGLPVRKEWILTCEDTAMSEEEVASLERMLCAPERPTAVFGAGFFFAAETLKVAKEVGLRVPDDLSVVGFDNPASAVYLAPPLTTMEQPLYEMGRRSLAKLLETLESNPSSPIKELLPAQLVVRASTAPPPSVLRQPGPRGKSGACVSQAI